MKKITIQNQSPNKGYNNNNFSRTAKYTALFSLLIMTACGWSDSNSTATEKWKTYDQKKQETCDITSEKEEKIKDLKALQMEIEQLTIEEKAAILAEEEALKNAKEESTVFKKDNKCCE